MNFSIILAHPNPDSFNHAIARAAMETLQRGGGNIWWHDLYAEKFDPVMGGDEFAKTAVLPPQIARHCDEIVQADGIVIVHPNWWSQPPAILKGWVDRALRPGRAYTFVAGPNGEGKPMGLLKAKSALVITTANTPQEKEVEFLGDPLGLFWQKVVFGLCGVADCQRLVFTPLIVSQPEQRAHWLKEVQEKVAAMYCG